MAISPTLSVRKELLNHVIDSRAREKPESLYAEYPISQTTFDEGFLKITYADFANAINGVAWWLHDTLGPSTTFETLGYMGTHDVRYNALVLGAVKAGYKVLLTSPRNSMAAHLNLFNVLDCQIFITSNPRPQAVTTIAAAYDIRILEIPTVETLLKTKYPHYPYNKTFEENRYEPLVVLHTSGTTGLPKPIVWTHDFGASQIDVYLHEAPPGYMNQHRIWTGGRVFLLFPPFHAGGLFGTLLGAIYCEAVVILPPAAVIPSAQVLVDALKHAKATCASIVPLVADELSKKPELLSSVSEHLEYMFYAGGNITQAAGDIISSKIKLFSLIGSTETGLFVTTCPIDSWPRNDWNCFNFHPVSGLQMQHMSGDEYEAVITRQPEGEPEPAIFKIFPKITEYRTGDLYSPHPTKPGLWKYRGRSDDIIVFLTGEKTNPISMEDAISHHPEVRSVLVIGALRFQAALLVELVTTEQLSASQRAEVIERLWPTIQKANLECPRHAQIKKSHIMFITPDKPAQRTAKGTIQRKSTLALYAEAIDTLYADADKISTTVATNGTGPVVTIDPKDSKAVKRYITEQLANSMGSKHFDDDENFFIAGMDSLQAVQMTRKLKAALTLPDFEVSTFYANPSIAALSKAILEMSEEHTMSVGLKQSSRSQEIEKVLAEYKALLDEITRVEKPSVLSNGYHIPEAKGRVVLLTGSTGAIGSYILQELLENSGVSHIYCLNRASNGSSLQVMRNKSRGLSLDFPPSRVTFLSTDLSKDHLGLELSDYERLRTSVTDIIHNAWPVNFNLSLATFAPNLLGTVNLIKLAASATHSSKFLFVSSISSIMGSSVQPVPEKIITDPLAPAPMGYAESKHITEQLLGYAGTILPNANIVIVRVGQVAGPANAPGHWNKQEWFPSLVSSSLYLGILPDSLGNGPDVIDWVPIDFLARTLVEFVLSGDDSDEADATKVFHPRNPHPTSWNEIRPVVAKVLNRLLDAKPNSENIKEVPLSTWVERVRNDAQITNGASQLEAMLESNPAAKLVSFYEGLVLGNGTSQVSGERAVAASKSLKDLNGLKDEWLERWIGDWIGTPKVEQQIEVALLQA